MHGVSSYDDDKMSEEREINACLYACIIWFLKSFSVNN